MKLIDLINDLFDYREFQTDKLPKKIRFNNKEFVFVDNSYYNENGINIMAYVDNTLDLRVEIEIIEEDKEIEEAKLKLFEDTGEAVMFPRIQEYNEFNIKELKRVTDELIKAVNELKKGK